MTTSDKIFRRKVHENYQEVAQRVAEHPMFTDLSKVENLHSIFTTLVYLPVNPKSSEVTDFRTLFIAVVLKLYDPDYMKGYKKKVKNGLRLIVASLLGIGFSYTSDLFSIAVARVQIYKNIADDVDRLSKRIIGSLALDDIKRSSSNYSDN